MRKVRCYDCRKSYDYDDDGFCPNCGAFNLPWNTSTIQVDGEVRREGINERNHKDSFLHAELHEENRKRKGTPLEQGTKSAKTMVKGFRREKRKEVSVVRAVVFAIIALNLLIGLLETL